VQQGDVVAEAAVEALVVATLELQCAKSMLLPEPPRSYRRSYRGCNPHLVRYQWAVDLGLVTPREVEEMQAIDSFFGHVARRELRLGREVALTFPDGTRAMRP
jgi:hypothetical protein